MKTIVSLVFASLCVWAVATAQIPPHFSRIETGFVSQEEMPPLEALNELSPSGESNNAWFPNLKAYVRDNIHYPGSARESGTEGVVHAEATVKADGKLTNIQVVDGLSYSCDKEVVRLLSDMPSWNPARRDGQPIEQKVYLRVRFKLKPF
jgi:TonB family protein